MKIELIKFYGMVSFAVRFHACTPFENANPGMTLAFPWILLVDRPTEATPKQEYDIPR